MIDMHAHILPGMDDGAADVRESIEMAMIAVESGVNAIVATPHYNLPNAVDQYTAREYVDNIRHIRELLKAERIPLKLIAGMEVFVTPDICKLIEERKIYTINKSRYLLVEFDFGEEPEYIQQMLDNYVGGHKAFPVAHDVVDAFVESKKKGKLSLSADDTTQQQYGNYNVYGKVICFCLEERLDIRILAHKGFYVALSYLFDILMCKRIGNFRRNTVCYRLCKYRCIRIRK